MVVTDGETSVPKYENMYEFECMYESYVLKTNPFRFLLHNPLTILKCFFCMHFRSVIYFCFHVLKFQDYTDIILLHIFFYFHGIHYLWIYINFSQPKVQSELISFEFEWYFPHPNCDL